MRTSKRVIIEPKPGGWLIVGNGEITLNIHPDCNAGKVGRLRRVALEVYDTLENLPGMGREWRKS